MLSQAKRLPDVMVQTRGQQAGEQSPVDVSGVDPRGVTTKGNTVTAAAYSGHALKNTIPGVCPGHSTDIPRCVCSDRGSAALWSGANSLAISVGAQDDECKCAESMSILRNVAPIESMLLRIRQQALESQLDTWKVSSASVLMVLWGALPVLRLTPSLVFHHQDTLPLPGCGFGVSEWSHAQCKPIFAPGHAQPVWTACPSSA